jgi:hypothetical protein
MKAKHGAFDRQLASSLNQMTVTLRAASLPMRWIHCGLTADLFASYYASELSDEGKDDQMLSQEEISSNIRYAMNELIENAVKFHVPGDIVIRSKIVYTFIVFLISNPTSFDAASSLDLHLKSLTSGDAAELMRQKVEVSALSDDKSSGIGFLTLMSDYGAVLGWNLESINDSKVQVETMMRLSLYKNEDLLVDSVGFTRRR